MKTQTVEPRKNRDVSMEQIIKISARQLNLWYGTKQALIDVNLDILERKVTAFIGPSGCGKSTFLRTLNRMNELIEGVRISGQVEVDKVNIYEKQIDPVELRKKVGMIFQKSNPFPSSIYDNISFGPKLMGITARDKLDHLVEDCLKKSALWNEVKDDLKKSAYSLSGGQQQRLCIARALAVNPEVILMDEPTSALDPRSTAGIEDLIRELVVDYTIVIVTHNMQQASRISDNTAFFYEGKLIELGETGQMFTNPVEKQTEDYITGRFG